jgi:hypothetical protein
MALSALYRESDAPGPPLRIGAILSNETVVPAYVASILRDVRGASFTQLALAVLPASTAPRAGKPAEPRSLVCHALAVLADPGRRPHALHELYRRFESRGAHADDPLAAEDARALLDGVERLELGSAPPGSGPEAAAAIDAAELERLRSARLDVLLHLGGPRPSPQVFTCAKFGVWFYVHGAGPRYRGADAHLWELIEGYPRAGVALHALTADVAGGVELCAAAFNVPDTPFASRSHYAPYWESAHFAIWKLWQLHREGWARVLEQGRPAAPSPLAPPPRPRNRDLARWVAGLLARKLSARAFGRRVDDHWELAVRTGARPLTREDGDLDMRGFRALAAPRDHFWADPFVAEEGGRRLLFFEDFRRDEGRGVIAAGELTGEGRLEDVRTVLDTGSHLSYPLAFAHEGHWFMIPESLDTGEVALYRAAPFPDRWVKEATLFRGNAVDTTAFRHDERWWFLTTLVERPRNSGTLMLFSADSLTGAWRYHPANPVSTDVRWSRNAGAVVRDGDRLIRPSQSGSPAYGYSFTLHHIEVCSESTYRETSWRTFRPTWRSRLAGTHTYAAGGGLEVIDVRTQRWAPRHGRRIRPSTTLSAWMPAPRDAAQ